MDIKFGKKVFIRNANKDEYWLQSEIYKNPSILGLGDLVTLSKEKTQSSGGRLDILLKDNSDNAMYEVEVMLGETDPSHIIRTIEYWDNEKRKFPQRQHFAVLVAESFDRRYFNVVQLLSLNIPMIAIQADLLQVNDEYVLNFTKILNIYEEPSDMDEVNRVDETTWKDLAPWTLEVANLFLKNLEGTELDATLNYTQSYISVMINGKNLFYLKKRTELKSSLSFKVKDDEKFETIQKILTDNNIEFDIARSNEIIILLSTEIFKTKVAVFIEITSVISRKLNLEIDV